MSWTLIADGVVAFLLFATLIYVRRFSARLESIRAGRVEFEELIASLTKSTEQAASHLRRFKATAEVAGGDLQARIDRAQGLAAEFGRIGDDLRLLTDRAESAADRLESAVGRSRHSAAVSAPKPAASTAAAHAPLPVVSMADDDDDRSVACLGALSGMR